MNQTSELLFYFVCMESFRYTQACAGVPEEVFQMSYPEVDFLYLNEEDMVAAGVRIWQAVLMRWKKCLS